jgi:DNA-binding GntR family transcriptional regulator
MPAARQQRQQHSKRHSQKHPKAAPSKRLEPQAQQTPGASGEEVKRAARKDRVIKAILHAIFSREVVGGDRLVEEELATKLGVSRTPIREGLRELTGVGVIWLKPNHGAMVRPFGATQLLEIYQLRRLLESEATRLATKSINRERLQEIKGGMQALLAEPRRDPAWSAAALALDGQLHELISQSSGSERLAEEIHRYWLLAQSIAEAVRNTSYTQDRAIQEHTEIIDRLLAHDAEGASKAMGRHIEQRAQAALDALCPPSGRAALRALLDQAAADQRARGAVASPATFT